MGIYDFLTPNEHFITVRDRVTGLGVRHRYWNNNVISKILRQQTESQDIFVTKYPTSREISTIILDYDSDTNPNDAFKEAKRLKGYLTKQGHNCVLVDSTNKGTHLYCQIAPFKFADAPDERRGVKDWGTFFKDFVYYMIDKEAKHHKCLDTINLNAGMGGNIRLIGSRHPSTGKEVKIIEGEFIDNQIPTSLQSKAQVRAWHKADLVQKDLQKKLRKTQIVDGVDPIANNDLRVILPQITGEEIKLYSRGYGYMRCFNHNDNHPSMLVTKEFFSCASCNCKGNIFTLKRLKMVDFDMNGEVIL